MANEDAKFTIDDHADRAVKRLTGRHCEADILKKWIRIYADRIQALEDVTSRIKPSVLFDITTAIGAQLDQIGTILALPRQERNDAQYRIMLRTQALIVLPERRSAKRLLQIVRSLSDTDIGLIVYRIYDVKSFEIAVSSATLEALASWIPILRRCRPATYNMLVCWSQPGHLSLQDGRAAPLVGLVGGAGGYADGRSSPLVAPVAGAYGYAGIVDV
jgi:hypothetical protein